MNRVDKISKAITHKTPKLLQQKFNHTGVGENWFMSNKAVAESKDKTTNVVENTTTLCSLIISLKTLSIEEA